MFRYDKISLRVLCFFMFFVCTKKNHCNLIKDVTTIKHTLKERKKDKDDTHNTFFMFIDTCIRYLAKERIGEKIFCALIDSFCDNLSCELL